MNPRQPIPFEPDMTTPSAFRRAPAQSGLGMRASLLAGFGSGWRAEGSNKTTPPGEARA